MMEHIFVNTIEQAAGQGDIEFLRLAQVFGHIDKGADDRLLAYDVGSTLRSGHHTSCVKRYCRAITHGRSVPN